MSQQLTQFFSGAKGGELKCDSLNFLKIKFQSPISIHISNWVHGNFSNCDPAWKHYRCFHAGSQLLKLPLDLLKGEFPESDTTHWLVQFQHCQPVSTMTLGWHSALCVCVCVDKQGCASSSSCATGSRRWYLSSRTARQSHMSPLHVAASVRRLCCQDAFTVKPPTRKLKLPKGKVCSTLAGES